MAALFSEYAIRETLRIHWLVSVNCDREKKTNRAQCSCSLVTFLERPSVSAAVDDWVGHVIAELIAGQHRNRASG